jgi:enamine deaminase RidA (YjgF/YER057c/UK114 family)
MLSPNALDLATCLASAPSAINDGVVSSRSRSRRIRHGERNSSKWQRGRLFRCALEDAYGYAQAIKVDDTIYVSGQLSHDEKGNLMAPASLDESDKPAEFSMMERQLRATYANAVKLLARFGASLDNVVEETLYVRIRRESLSGGQPL